MQRELGAPEQGNLTNQEDLDGAKENLVAATKIMYRSKKKFALASVLGLLSLICEERGDHINTRRYGKSARAFFKKALPDPPFADDKLERSRLALMHGDVGPAMGDAKVAPKMFKKTGCASDQEDTPSVLDIIACELDWRKSSSSVTQAGSDTA